MNNRIDAFDLNVETKRLISSHTLKRCTLCGAVNALSNEECFVCRWHGDFDTSPSKIEEGVHQLLGRCPELAVAMMDSQTQARRRKTWIQRLAAGFARLLRGKYPHSVGDNVWVAHKSRA